MDPARMSMTLVLLLGLGGIGGAVRACASASRAGARVGARSAARAARTMPKIRLPRASGTLTRRPGISGAAAGRLGRSQRAGAAVAAGSIGDDGARVAGQRVGSTAGRAADDLASVRVSSRGGKGGKLGDQASNGLDLVDTDDDD